MSDRENELVKTITAFDWTVKFVAPVDAETIRIHEERVQRLLFETPEIGGSLKEKMYGKLPPGYIAKSSVYCIAGGLIGFGAVEFLFGGETFYEKAVMPIIHKMADGETAHRWAISSCKYGLLPRFGPNHWEYPELECEFIGRKLKNPIGLAAGFDKNGDAILPLANSGFGMIEIGSITPLPQPGNAYPRVFRLEEDKATINRYGFNSDGVGRVQQRVKAARGTPWSPEMAIFGVNLGKNKLTDEENTKLDYEVGVNYFAGFSDYLVVNVSSPNTPGLRSMQGRKQLEQLLSYVKRAVEMHKLEKPPRIFLKIAPDLVEAELKDIAKVVLDSSYGVTGLIISNTTITRPPELRSEHKNEIGGLSGAPVKALSTECIRKMYRLTNGKVAIIGCGGVGSGEDAYEKIRAGASVVQLYTAMVYLGFPVIGKVKRELVECLRRDGFSNVSQAIGADHRK
ncbi:unnamed protein product, partial [Mesorhabditis belari]|uniref:Dihydroorotate dehydrogenase (quinone), mitochondrial n=1 Tax=Mesorhabditis belari TaxID=2138241 RepID=A0AAF3F1X6_9BILA